MRRSAAPSLKADIKRARFLPQVLKNITLNDKENTCHATTFVKISSTTSESSNSGYDMRDGTTTSNIDGIRTNKDVLNLIFEADSSTVDDTNDANVLSNCDKINADNCLKFYKPPIKGIKVKAVGPLEKESVEECKNLSDCIFCVKSSEDASLFSVVWCKRSGKKHKTWEGDGLLIVKNRSAVLKDLNGKTLDKSLGYKLKETESLEEGSKFFIGGKECEIQSRISQEECLSGKYCKCTSTIESLVQQPESSSVKQHKPR